MKRIENIGLPDVQAVYSGPEGDLWELVMGEQIHIGGFASSMDLAERAGIVPGSVGIDLCCCNGAGMRFLIRFRGVAEMTGVDATERVVELGRRRCRDEGLGEQNRFLVADATESGLPGASADFVWGEDAWCYVEDKDKLVAEAARLVRPGGTVAFTDWVEGPAGLSPEEAERLLRFMKFPGIQDIDGYSAALTACGLEVSVAEDTGRFPTHIDLYLEMLGKQLTYDALKIIGFDLEMMGGMEAEMKFMQTLAHQKKIAQGMFVATRP